LVELEDAEPEESIEGEPYTTNGTNSRTDLERCQELQPWVGLMPIIFKDSDTTGDKIINRHIEEEFPSVFLYPEPLPMAVGGISPIPLCHQQLFWYFQAKS
jgi:hypothetical protein